MSDENVKSEIELLSDELVQKAAQQGYLTTDDLLAAFPEAEENMAQLEEIFIQLIERGIEVYSDAEEAEEEKRLREALGRGEAEVRSLDEDIALALAGGKDDLARFAIRRLLPRRSALKALHVQIEQLAVEERGLAERLAVQEAQFDGLRARVRAELLRERESDDPSVWPCDAGVVADEEVELELMRRRGEGGVAS